MAKLKAHLGETEFKVRLGNMGKPYFKIKDLKKWTGVIAQW